MTDFVQAERRLEDGAISVSRGAPGMLHLSVVTDGKEEGITLSEYNAARIFGCIAVMLGIPLGNKVGKAIKL
jgi:hypothetical protein